MLCLVLFVFVGVVNPVVVVVAVELILSWSVAGVECVVREWGEWRRSGGAGATLRVL